MSDPKQEEQVCMVLGLQGQQRILEKRYIPARSIRAPVSPSTPVRFVLRSRGNLGSVMRLRIFPNKQTLSSVLLERYTATGGLALIEAVYSLSRLRRNASRRNDQKNKKIHFFAHSNISTSSRERNARATMVDGTGSVKPTSLVWSFTSRAGVHNGAGVDVKAGINLLDFKFACAVRARGWLEACSSKTKALVILYIE